MTWDAAAYDRLADPQEAWAREILQRARIQRHETVLDAGSGSGRVTRLLLEHSPSVVAVDADPAMVELARASLPAGTPVLRQDLLELAVEPVDVVFSCAVFHWITDHETLFERLRAALKPGGRLVAQCGGHGNLARVLEVVGQRPGTWLYATPEDTERRLRAAGFTSARAWLEPKPTRVGDLAGYLETVVLHGQPDAHEQALHAAALLDELDYVRLNLDAVA
ncbi:MAG: methyltransferase domain-containing protein [Solirubrobacterales bacterium]|nr:methyltransferase domain-containing protein [Solirubrobacterales bacterium]